MGGKAVEEVWGDGGTGVEKWSRCRVGEGAIHLSTLGGRIIHNIIHSERGDFPHVKMAKLAQGMDQINPISTMPTTTTTIDIYSLIIVR